jgi:hypothetical protein
MNYQVLTNLITFYIHRDDLVPFYDQFQELALENIMQRSRLIVLEARGSITFNGSPQPLPVDWFSFKAVRHGSMPLSPMSKPQLDDYLLKHRGSAPLKYTVDAGLDIGGFSGAVIDFTYYARPALLTGAGTNALIEKHPMLYFHAMSAQAHHAIQDTESQRVSQGEFDIAIDAANEQDRNAALSGGAPTMN